MDWIKPMSPILRSEVEQGEEWIHQIKWDGVRGLCYIDHAQIKLFTKNRRDRTPFYPELNKVRELLQGNQAILDGELIVLNPEGKPRFEGALVRERVSSLSKIAYYQRNYPVNYVVFDILYHNGNDLTQSTFIERDEILRNVLKQNELIGITDNFKNGVSLLEFMKEKGWEGIVSKRITSKYLPGKQHHDWFKTKLNKKLLVVVGGIQWKGDLPNALLLGLNTGKNNLQYIGKASIGLKQKDLKLLKENKNRLFQRENPFINEVTDVKIGDISWTKPVLTCWIEFLEWTGVMHLRHPKILGFSTLPIEKATGEEFIHE